MNKTIILVIYFFIHLHSFAQNNVYIDKPFDGLPWRQTEVIEINNLNQLPPRIPYIVDQLFKTSMTDFVTNIVFIKGQIIDLESWAAKDSSFQAEYQFVIPKYELFFELRDTTISIRRYCFRVSLDQYGQITQFDWPRENFNKRTNFIPGTILKKEAVKYAVKKHYKTKECLYNLVFDSYKKRLQWQISFLQKSTGDGFNYSKEYKTLVFDASSKEFIEELEMLSAGVSD